MQKIKNTYLNEVLSKLKSYSKRKTLLNVFSRFLKIFISSVLLFTFLVVLESIFNFSSDVRSILFFVFILTVLPSFAIIIIPLTIKYFRHLTNNDYYNLADEVGAQHLSVKDELINSLQLLNSDNKETSSI